LLSAHAGFEGTNRHKTNRTTIRKTGYEFLLSLFALPILRAARHVPPTRKIKFSEPVGVRYLSNIGSVAAELRARRQILTLQTFATTTFATAA
jgi:hypothetical protein